MVLPSVKDLKVDGKKVLLRTNYDVPLTSDGSLADESRIDESLKTIRLLLDRKAALVIITHLDRPGGKSVPGLSLKPVAERLEIMLEGYKIIFSKEILGEKTKRMAAALKSREILILENLRFDSGEQANDQEFAKGLAKLADFYVNDAFAVSHRKHASVASVPNYLPFAFGLDFLEEVKALSKLRDHPKRPLVVILGGKKKSKIDAAKKLTNWADYILVGGELVEYDGLPGMVEHRKILGSLTKEGEDITMETITEFKKYIAKAKTIVWSGPLGAFEEKKFEKGTREIAKAVVQSGAHTLVGGGDTEAALTKFGLVDKIDCICSGGGSMLAFLADGTLVGIKAIIKSGKVS